jgi:hypothetical protein
MLMRQKIRKRVVISCPHRWSSVAGRDGKPLGLTFIVFDREYVAAKRRERGYGINPWNTHTRFIISHSLRDETYAGSLRDWLGSLSRRITVDFG